MKKKRKQIHRPRFSPFLIYVYSFLCKTKRYVSASRCRSVCICIDSWCYRHRLVFFLVHLFSSSSSTTPLISCDIQRREKSNENPKFSSSPSSSSCTFLCSIDRLIDWFLCVRFLFLFLFIQRAKDWDENVSIVLFIDVRMMNIDKQQSEHKKSYTSHEKL